ncbi:hypothetical protein [Phenylobacterium sp.]|uniref:hypothetical protein n=1 Tax=Phenylobacterium sp. TaxID=1871053 RepID=UPI003982FFED
MRDTDEQALPTSRRALLAAGAASGLIAVPARAQPRRSAPRFTPAEMQRTFERYHAFGDKAAGGPGDNACGAWMIGELEALGYRCTRQSYEVPAYEGGPAELTSGRASATLIPQAIVIPTGREGLNGRLHLAGAPGDVRGAIAVIVLPHARWSAAKGEVERRVKAELSAGAAAAVVITTGPTGEALALNAPVSTPLFDKPVAVLAPSDAQPFVDAAMLGADATLRIPGRSIRRPAFNVIASLPRKAGRALIISTPRSGWFTCTGERGPGVAVWLALARWAARTPLNADIELLATSGHEYDNDGGEHYIHERAPKPADTALWVHLGANVAARDWHERSPLSPLPSADPQRYLLASAALLPAAKAAFAGLPGLEQVYPALQRSAAGELGNVLKAGYEPAIGIFGGHRFHHARSDDLRCVSPDLAVPVAEAFADVIESAVGRRRRA